ncbi:MAG TPA: FAD-binding oxidoreductase [Candidatus Binatia bacterium]|nr:FAD-binding oxidoreductase [Candidatus Binatia bacterium]
MLTSRRPWRGPAPLADQYRERPLWWDDASLPSPPSRALPGDADALVIGSGYTGLAAALELRKRGREVVVVDSAWLGRGASGRNAGMIHSGLHRDIGWLERHLGEAGLRLHEASREAVDTVERLAAEVAPDAGFRRCGWLHLAHRRSRVDGLRREASDRRRAGETTHLLAAGSIAEESGCDGFSGALLTDNGASIHPARYLAGLARAALTRGVEIHEGVTVLGLDGESRPGVRLATSAGTIRARDVLVATNGYTGPAFPELRRRVIPIGSYIIATEPLPAALAEAVSRRRRMMTDTRELLHYWRLSPDGRLVFGGRTSFTPISVEWARDRLYADMTRFYPQLTGIRVSRAWTGTVGFTVDRLPHLGRHRGVTHALGYCGSGVAMATWLGTRAGAWVAGGDAGPFRGLPFPTLPGYRGRPWFLPLAGWWYQLRDRL